MPGSPIRLRLTNNPGCGRSSSSEYGLSYMSWSRSPVCRRWDSDLRTSGDESSLRSSAFIPLFPKPGLSSKLSMSTYSSSSMFSPAVLEACFYATPPTFALLSGSRSIMLSRLFVKVSNDSLTEPPVLTTSRCAGAPAVCLSLFAQAFTLF